MRLTHILSIMSITFLLTGCYRMPSEGEYSVIPLTNSPDVTKHRNDFIPDMNN